MKLTKEAILERVTQQAIWERYFPETVKINKSYRNPLRNDKNPGCRFYTHSSGIMYFHDFSAGKQFNCFDWVQETYMCSLFEACKIINQDFGLGLGYAKTDHPITPKTVLKDKTPSKISIKERDWKISQIEMGEKDLLYWNQFGISENTLSFFNVIKADTVYLDGEFYCQSEEDDPVFAYLFPKKDRLKLYRPLTKIRKKKWGGYCTADVLQGYDQLPETGDLLIITKSLKDVMTLYELGYHAVAPSGENVLLSIELIEELKDRFKKVVVFFDNDGSFNNKKNGKGKFATRKYFEKYKLPFMFIPNIKYKDVSDYYKEYGEDTKTMLEVILDNASIRPEWT